MQSSTKLLIGIALIVSVATSFSFSDWGFFGHRRINRMAVFTLPPEMIRFYKQNIEYLTDHAVDPDKRRYATKHEAVRHYIDIDHWGEPPFSEVPRDWTEALMKYTDVYIIQTSGDTLHLFGKEKVEIDNDLMYFKDAAVIRRYGTLAINKNAYKEFFKQNVQSQYYEDEWGIDCDKLAALLDEELDCQKVYAIDRFSGYGICPYHLPVMQARLTKAFSDGNVKRILQLSAEIGHYIGDAHVPLHTTTNYNGQLTDQVGIHAFWESRLPELFADETYDFFVGKADYITNKKDYFWDVVLTSHQYVDSVLTIEKRLSQTFSQDKQFCYEDRLDMNVRTQCKDYSEAFHQQLDGQVERRMRDAILSIGSAWFTAWIDAGKPDLYELQELELTQNDLNEIEKLDKNYKEENIKGRKH